MTNRLTLGADRNLWIAFGLLIVGLVLTFYFPRRRAWARIGDRVELAYVADRYVDADREFFVSQRMQELRVPAGDGSGPAGPGHAARLGVLPGYLAAITRGPET